MTDIQKRLDEVIEELQQTLQEFQQKEFQQKLENGLISIKPTEFMCIDTNGEMTILDSRSIPAGTLIGGHNWKMFRMAVLFNNDEPWITDTGAKVSHEAFAEMARVRRTPPKIIHWGI